jgi:hypothetical protein
MGKNTNAKGRRIKGKFIAIPESVYNHNDFKSLSHRALRLLIDLLTQYNGHNNGDLCAAMTLMKRRGWKSNDQRNKALKELLDKELIVLTRQGGRKIASLYAVTWKPIDDCKGKIDISATKKPWRDFTKNSLNLMTV